MVLVFGEARKRIACCRLDSGLIGLIYSRAHKRSSMVNEEKKRKRKKKRRRKETTDFFRAGTVQKVSQLVRKIVRDIRTSVVCVQECG